jgi:hypothetical protein
LCKELLESQRLEPKPSCKLCESLVLVHIRKLELGSHIHKPMLLAHNRRKS